MILRTVRGHCSALMLLALLGCEDEPAVEDIDPAESTPIAAVPPKEATEQTPKVESSGVIEALEGEVMIIHGDQTTTAETKQSVFEGDTIKTGRKSKARLRLHDETIVALGARTEVTLSTFQISKSDRKAMLTVALGQFWAKVQDWSGGGTNEWDFNLPTAVAGIRGTHLWGDVSADTICAIEGKVEVRAIKAKGKKASSKIINKGQCVTKMAKGKVKKLKSTKKQWKTIRRLVKSISIEDG